MHRALVFLALGGDDRDWLIANVCALGSAHMHIELVLAEMVQLAAINMIIPLRK